MDFIESIFRSWVLLELDYFFGKWILMEVDFAGVNLKWILQSVNLNGRIFLKVALDGGGYLGSGFKC